MMRIILFLLCICLFTPYAIGDDFVRKTTWATDDLITAAKLNADLDEAARILGDNSDGLISNGNIKATAAISDTKISFSVTAGHSHDGSGSRFVSDASLKRTEHVTARLFRIGGDTAHTGDTNWDIEVTSNASKPTLRFKGAASGDGTWQISKGGSSFENISTGPSFIDRGNNADDDYIQSDLTMDSVWRDLDLGALISPGAKAVLLTVRISDAGSAGLQIQFRKNGNNTGFNISKILNQVTGVSIAGDFIVPLDSDRIIEYKSDANIDLIKITIKGWWE